MLLKENQSAWCENVNRPVFDSLLLQIKQGGIKDLYVWDLDRIHRNRKRLQEFFMLCKCFGCRIHSFRQKWLQEINNIPAPFDEIVTDMLINIFGWIGEEESTKRSERIRLAVVKRNTGTFSYKGNKWGRKGLPRQTVSRVLELHRKGMSIREIAAVVKVYDRNKNERSISKSAVHKLLSHNAA